MPAASGALQIAGVKLSLRSECGICGNLEAATGTCANIRCHIQKDT